MPVIMSGLGPRGVDFSLTWAELSANLTMVSWRRIWPSYRRQPSLKSSWALMKELEMMWVCCAMRSDASRKRYRLWDTQNCCCLLEGSILLTTLFSRQGTSRLLSFLRSCSSYINCELPAMYVASFDLVSEFVEPYVTLHTSIFASV